MRRLHIGQLVSVSIDDVVEPIDCNVVEVQGSTGRLSVRGELPPRAVGRLALGSGGYLVFDSLRAAVGLRIAVRASPPYLDVAVTDGVALPERRHSHRVKCATRARIVAPDRAGESQSGWTETINLSEQGALLCDHAAASGRKRFTLELMFGDDPEAITAEVRVVRRRKGAVAVVFESMPAADATRLVEYLMGMHHRQLAAELRA